MIVKTILIFIIGLIGYSEWLTGTSYLQRPIVLGPLVGLVMGDLSSGIIMGATLELAMIGAISVGAYNPPDLVSGSVMGISLAISAGAGPEAALTLGIPLAFYFGSDAVSNVLGRIPDFVQSGMEIAAALLPVFGFAMSAQQMMNKKVAPFFFIGFFLVAYSGGAITPTGVAIFAVCFVLFLISFGVIGNKNNVEEVAVADAEMGGDFDEF